MSFASVCLSQALDSSASLGKGQKRKAGQLHKAITIGSSAILYTQNTVSAGRKKKNLLQDIPSSAVKSSRRAESPSNCQKCFESNACPPLLRPQLLS